MVVNKRRWEKMAVCSPLTFVDLISRYLAVWRLDLPQDFEAYQPYVYKYAICLGEVGQSQPPLVVIDEFVYNLQSELCLELFTKVLDFLSHFSEYLLSRAYIDQNPFFSRLSAELQKSKNTLQLVPLLGYRHGDININAAKTPTAGCNYPAHLKIHHLKGSEQTCLFPKNKASIEQRSQSHKVTAYRTLSTNAIKQDQNKAIRTVQHRGQNLSRPTYGQKMFKLANRIERPVIDRGYSQTALTLSDLEVLKEWYLKERQTFGKKKISKSTANLYGMHIDYWFAFNKEKNYEQITSETLKAYVYWLSESLCKGKPLSPNTRALKKTALSGFLSFVKAKKGIYVPVFEEILAVSPDEKQTLDHHTPLHPDEIALCLKYLKSQSAQFKLEFLLPVGTGSRGFETKSIRYKDLDLAQGVIHLKGKGKKNREVPIPSLILPIIMEVIRNCDDLNKFIFSTRQSDQITEKALQNHLASITRGAGLKWVPTLHDLRKTYCTNEIKYGNTDAFTLAKRMGHVDVNTTAIYVEKTPRSTDIDLETLHKEWALILYGTDDIPSLIYQPSN
jgi:integrase